jgi:hypothetical protein
LGNTLRRLRWVGHVEGTDDKKNIHRFLVGKVEGKRPLIRPRHKWKTILTHTIKK